MTPAAFVVCIEWKPLPFRAIAGRLRRVIRSASRDGQKGREKNSPPFGKRLNRLANYQRGHQNTTPAHPLNAGEGVTSL